MKHEGLPKNCDGLNIMQFCDDTDPNCMCGSCWHASVISMRVRLWFSHPKLLPVRAQGELVRREATPEPPRTAQEQRIANLVATRRVEEGHWMHREMYPHAYGKDGKPRRFPAPRCQGTGGVWPDEDGVGSWGRCVRILEDSQ